MNSAISISANHLHKFMNIGLKKSLELYSGYTFKDISKV